MRIRLLELPLERDEGEYAYAGQLMLQGIPPYETVYTVKFPGTHAAYALIIALFGESIQAIRIGLLLVNAATILLMFLLARRLLDVWAGVVAAATYATLSLGLAILGQAAHATHFVVLTAVGGILLLLRAAQTLRPWGLFVSGLLLGLSVLMKQAGVFFVLFAGLALLMGLLRTPTAAWRRLVAATAFFALGAAAPLGLTLLVLWLAGVFENFWFWTFVYAREYGTIFTLSRGWAQFRLQAGTVMQPAWPLWTLGAMGVILLWRDRLARARWVFFAGFSVFSFLAVCPGFYFREHYFILLLPAVALLAGATVTCGARMLAGMRLPAAAWRGVPAIALIAACGYAVYQDRTSFFTLSPRDASRERHSVNPFPESEAIARYIKSHSDPTHQIAVVGSEPQIYFLSDRRSATGYIYVYGLMEPQPYALRMHQEMIREIESARPEFIVYVNVAFSWLRLPDSPNLIFDWTGQYLERLYRRVGVIDILSPQHTEYRWDDEAIGYAVRSPSYLMVFRRKTAA
ncbi:MAG: ArnT family glycosyltransferase [Candidatus Methylomirabilia bacterium]